MSNCRICDRPLRDPESVRRGYGRRCARKLRVYEAALRGGRHTGYLTRIQHLADQQVERAIQSLERQLETHSHKVHHPAQALQRDSWDALSPEWKKGIVDKWKREIKIFQEQIWICQMELHRRQQTRST
ncbi:MAG: DUF6011 domain-containing protein [Alicyclobacillus sp.]|nr:DUF6011 domain-containing protein [Alicyclobacillus sp.]